MAEIAYKDQEDELLDDDMKEEKDMLDSSVMDEDQHKSGADSFKISKAKRDNNLDKNNYAPSYVPS